MAAAVDSFILHDAGLVFLLILPGFINLASHGHTTCLVGWTPLLVLLKNHLLLFSLVTYFLLLGVHPALFPGFRLYSQVDDHPSMWDLIRYQGITNASSARRLLRDVVTIPLRLCLLLSLTQLYSCSHRQSLMAHTPRCLWGLPGLGTPPGFWGLGAGACCATGSSTRQAGCGPCTQSRCHGSSTRDATAQLPVADAYPPLGPHPASGLCAPIGWASLARPPLGPTSPLPASLCAL